MYRKFREDPSSVDPSWHEFLVDYSPEPTDRDERTARRAVNGKRRRRRANQTPRPPPKAAPAKAAGPRPKPAKADAAPRQTPPSPRRAKAEPAPRPTSAKTRSGQARSPPKLRPPPTATRSQVLRGAAAAVVKNMNASLDVPTATSVRAIPAKLMIDNRIVINNHLKRTRGGKI